MMKSRRTLRILVGLVFIGGFLLAGCQKIKPKVTQPDLTGTYYYDVSNQFSVGQNDGQNDLIHVFYIRRTDMTNKKYDVEEKGSHSFSEGKMTVDGNIMNMHLSKSSKNLDGNFAGARNADIKKVRALNFTFKNGLLIINRQIFMYNDKSNNGRKLGKVFSGYDWDDVFQESSVTRKSSSTQFSSSSNKMSSNSNSSAVSSSISSSTAQASSEHPNPNEVASGSDVKSSVSSMDINSIQNGDYSTLKGNWEEVAVSGSGLHGGQGLQWSKDPTDLSSNMKIENGGISDGDILLNGNQIYEGGAPNYADYAAENGALTASTDNDDNPTNYAVKFYPKGVPIDMPFNNGVADDTSANRVIFWNSSNNYSELFKQQ